MSELQFQATRYAEIRNRLRNPPKPKLAEPVSLQPAAPPEPDVFFRADAVVNAVMQLDHMLQHLRDRSVVITHLDRLDQMVSRLREKFGVPQNNRPTISSIQNAVAKFYDLTKVDLIAERRTARIVLPRQIAMYLCRTLTICSLPTIGAKFGGKDHTTVMHAVKTIEQRKQTDAVIAADIEVLIQQLKPSEVACVQSNGETPCNSTPTPTSTAQ